jgi:hypothetical protein
MKPSYDTGIRSYIRLNRLVTHSAKLREIRLDNRNPISRTMSGVEFGLAIVGAVGVVDVAIK